jgi:hypothetical protein
MVSQVRKRINGATERDRNAVGAQRRQIQLRKASEA